MKNLVKPAESKIKIIVEITEENAEKYHKFMWRWLSKHPDKKKEDWPGWKRIDKPNFYWCPACTIASINRNYIINCYHKCSVCPIKEWRDNFYLFEECDLSVCEILQFGVWDIRNRTDEGKRMEAAKEISELTWSSFEEIEKEFECEEEE